MEDLDNETIEQLKAKAIERGGDDSDIITNEIDEELKDPQETVQDVVVEEPPKEVKKPKRERSEKQKAAFEKARLKRAENLKIKKQIEAEKKQKLKEEKEQVKKEVRERLADNHSMAETKKPTSVPQPMEQRYQEPQPRYREQVVNNYYYYGTDFQPPTYTQSNPAIQYYEPEPQPEKPKRGRKKKVVVKEPEPETASESEEEEIVYSDPEEPQSYKELQNFVEEEQRQLPPKQNNGLKFRFA
tara:strand:+ start:882 stop:1610 length:729 start_codon:yes stop_codon:yes gene_type:complete